MKLKLNIKAAMAKKNNIVKKLFANTETKE
jgi:hypothetical protein